MSIQLDVPATIRRMELGQCQKCRAFIRLGWNVADARVELRRAQNQLLRLRGRRSREEAIAKDS
jgi:hypothetical protein